MTTKPLKIRVKEELEIRKISFLELERQTGIKANRMYKWYQQDTNPKKEDADKLEEWLDNLEKPTNKAKEPTKDPPNISDAISEPDLRIAIRELSESTNRHSVIDERNSRNIERLISLLEFKFSLEDKGLLPKVGEGGAVDIREKSKKNQSGKTG